MISETLAFFADDRFLRDFLETMRYTADKLGDFWVALNQNRAKRHRRGQGQERWLSDVGLDNSGSHGHGEQQQARLPTMRQNEGDPGANRCGPAHDRADKDRNE